MLVRIQTNVPKIFAYSAKHVLFIKEIDTFIVFELNLNCLLKLLLLPKTSPSHKIFATFFWNSCFEWGCLNTWKVPAFLNCESKLSVAWHLETKFFSFVIELLVHCFFQNRNLAALPIHQLNLIDGFFETNLTVEVDVNMIAVENPFFTTQQLRGMILDII